MSLAPRWIGPMVQLDSAERFRRCATCSSRAEDDRQQQEGLSRIRCGRPGRCHRDQQADPCLDEKDRRTVWRHADSWVGRRSSRGRGRGASSRTGRAGILRPGAAGDGRGVAGSGRSRWRDPSSACPPAGRSGRASRPRSLPRTPTPSHRRVERGPDCRPPSSPRDTSSDMECPLVKSRFSQSPHAAATGREDDG